MADIPNLAGVATADLVEKIGGGNFQASYINWSRTLHLLRTNAPGWLPELVPTTGGAILHEAPQGAFLLIRFRHTDGTVTPEVPQAIMDTRNAAIPTNKVTARDITDTHRRGVCMAAAFTFGLAYELWAKLPLESGYHDDAQPAKPPRREIDVFAIVHSIAHAQNMESLKGHFTAAWQMLEGEDREKAKAAYDTRKNQLEEKETA